jgi:hypothetical protein
MKKGRRLAGCFLGGMALAATKLAFAGPTAGPQRFLEFLSAVDQAQPPNRADLEHLIGRTLQCMEDPTGRIDCSAQDVEFAGVKVGGVDFRWTRNNGSILVLDHLTGECVRVDEFDKQFGQGFVHSSCTDGVICVYRSYRRSWGILSAGLDRDPSEKCAKSIVMNTASH